MPTSDVPLSSAPPPAKVGLPTLREQQTQGDLRRLLEKPLGDIRRAIDADNPHNRGLALEALAVRLMSDVDLVYVTTRLRGTDTGGTDVDVIFESTHLVFSRWQVRCKRTDCVSLDDVTYSLDDATVRRIRRTAERLGLPQSRAVREAVAEYDVRTDRLSETERLRMLDLLDGWRKKQVARSREDVESELREIRRSRRDGWERRSRRDGSP